MHDIYRQTLARNFQLVYCQIYQAEIIHRILSRPNLGGLAKYSQLDQDHPPKYAHRTTFPSILSTSLEGT